MRWALIILFSFIGTSFSSDDTNEVIVTPSPTKSPINLDTNLRKALLKALVELENEEQDNHQRDTRNDYVNIITHLGSTDKSVEKASASSVSFFSRPEAVNMTITVKKSTSKPKHSVVVQKSKDSKTIYDVEDLKTSDNPEQIIASASNSFTSGKTQKSKTISGGAQLNSLTAKEKRRRNKYEQTTTLKPTSSTEESEANVESLQFFSAPLVAAFTVHQDEKGLPKSVVPIYNQGNAITSTTEKQEQLLKNQEELQREVLKQQKELEARQEEDLRNKQLKLEEEIQRLTKLREEQERIIREQKLIYEQKLLEQERKLFEKQRLFNNVQSFAPIPATTTTPKPVFQTTPNNFRSDSGNTGTLVAVQPSVRFVPPVESFLPQNAQILPIKNPVDFRTPFPQFGQLRTINTEPRQIGNGQIFLGRPESRLVPSIPFNPNQNSIVPSLSTAENSIIPSFNTLQNGGIFQSLPSTQVSTSFQPSNNFFVANQQLPVSTSHNTPFRSFINTTPTHGTRNLRQESGTGNFLNNNRFNAPDLNNNFFGNHRFNANSFSSQQVSQVPQFTRNNFGLSNPNSVNQYQYNTLQYSVDQPFVKDRLNNLLLTNGFGQGKQQENLNIVSKVLSLNHLGSDSQTANSNDFKRIRASPSWRVV